MKKLVIRVFAVLAVVVIIAAALVLFSSFASAHTYEHKTQFATQCETVNPVDKHALDPVMTVFSVQLCYNGVSIWANRVDCNLYALGATATNTWCNVSVNNSSYVEFGNNYTYTYYGGWLQGSGYNRVRYNAWGVCIMNQGV